MKITNALLLMSAVVIVLLARVVLADALSSNCPGTITWDAAHNSQLACPATCVHDGKSGVCQEFSGTGGPVAVWAYDQVAAAWVPATVGNPPQPLLYTGTIAQCYCRINEGTEADPEYIVYFNPCCVLFRIAAFDGNVTHMCGAYGTCGATGCPQGTCQPTGNNAVATAHCG